MVVPWCQALAAEVLEDGDHFHGPEATGSTGKGVTMYADNATRILLGSFSEDGSLL